jgi:diguanylate cyclase (GGDEF)-like protein/PAS domain S-box-containing protein
MLKGEIIPATQYDFVAKNGTLKHIEIHGSPLIRDGQVAGTISVARDITKRKDAEFRREAALEALRESEEKYRRIAENMSNMVSDIDAEGNFTYISPSNQRILGYRPEDLIGKAAYEKLHPDDKDRILFEYNLAVMTKIDGESEYRYQHADGHYVWLHSTGHIILGGAGEYLGAIINSIDITERKLTEDALKKSEKKYRELSIIDDLTQLYNSRHFHVQIEIEIERSNRYGQPLTLLLLDLDKFKKFNDKYGHVEGDNVLSKLGQVIKRCLRDPDSAYRYGGEEFTIMLPMTTSEEGIVTAKRIQTELRKENFSPVLDQNINMTVSIGMAQYNPMEDMKTFVRRVDKLMYQAKKDGRDRICPDIRGRKGGGFVGLT